MRFLTTLIIAIISLSGCAVDVPGDEPSNATDSTTTCTRTVNGVTQACNAAPNGPKENVTISARAPLTRGLDQSWGFAVHEGANSTAVWFGLDTYDGGSTGVVAQRGCVKLLGPTTKTVGMCGNGNINIVVSGNGLITGPTQLIDLSGLPVGDYVLSADIPPGVADYRVAITVTY